MTIRPQPLAFMPGRLNRVLIYRFEEEGHGQVIAEASAPSMELFNGLFFPASDNVLILALATGLLQRLALPGQNVRLDEPQCIGQVVAVDRCKCRFVTVDQAVHQQRGIRRDRVAIH